MAKHGDRTFDKEYYKRFFVDYGKDELQTYYRWHWGWANFLNKYIPLRNGKGKRVLELGSSIGSFARVLKERNFEVVASDISSFIVQKGKKVLKGVTFIKVDVEKGIKIKGQFDYIFAFEILEHLKNPEKAIRNIKGKLEKGGVFVFSTPFPTKRSLKDPTHINVHPASYWIKLGKKIGFSKVKVVYATFVPFLYRISRYLSVGFALKTDIPFVNSTTFMILKK